MLLLRKYFKILKIHENLIYTLFVTSYSDRVYIDQRLILKEKVIVKKSKYKSLIY